MVEHRNKRGLLAGAATAVGAVFLALLGAGVLPFGPNRYQDDETVSMTDDYVADDYNAVASQSENLVGSSNLPAQADPGPRNVSPEEAAGALFVDNRCDRSVRISFAYLSAGGWQTHGGVDWTIEAYDGTYPLFENQPLRPESSEIYFEAHTLDNATFWRGDRTFAGGARTLYTRPAAVDVDQLGRKVITLTCSGQAEQTNAPPAAN